MHDYDRNCQCYRCKGIRNAPGRKQVGKYHSVSKRAERKATRAEQHARYLDCGPQAWDDRDSPSGDY
jgi:hypothetical protein